MPDENSTPIWWDQSTTPTQTTTTNWNQDNKDFILDFWEDVNDTENSSNKNDNLPTESDWNNIEDSIWDYTTTETNDETENNIIKDENSNDNIYTDSEELNKSQTDNNLSDKEWDSDLDFDFQLDMESDDNSWEIYNNKTITSNENPINNDFDVEENLLDNNAENEIFTDENTIDESTIDENPINNDFDVEENLLNNNAENEISTDENTIDENTIDENPINDDFIDEENQTEKDDTLNIENQNHFDSEIELSPIQTINEWNIIDTENTPQNNNIWINNENFIFSHENDSETSEINQFKIIDQPDSPIERQPNIQDYQNNTFNDNPSFFKESEETSFENPTNSNDTPNNEYNNTLNMSNYPWLQDETQNTPLNETQSTNQESFINQNSEIWDLHDSNTENSFTNEIDTPNEIWINGNWINENINNSTQTYVENIFPQIENNSTTQESQWNEIYNNWTNDVSSNNNTEIPQMQSTLSLDQILDSELSSNPKYSDNSISIPENKNKPPLQTKKISTILVWIWIFILTWFVVVLAFPSWNSDRKPWDEVNNTWNVHGAWIELDYITNSWEYIPDPDFESDFPDPIITWEVEEQYSPTIQPESTTFVVDFPDSFDEWDEDITNTHTDPIAIPYIWTSEYEYKNEEQENKDLKTNIMESISSFKSQGEIYHSYWIENSDRKVVKYALQVINTCEIYEEQIWRWEWINQESFNEFKNKVSWILLKIEEHINWWWDDYLQVIQNNIESNEKNNEIYESIENEDSIEKEELKEYIYSR